MPTPQRIGVATLVFNWEHASLTGGRKGSSPLRSCRGVSLDGQRQERSEMLMGSDSSYLAPPVQFG